MSSKIIVLACLLAVANARTINNFGFNISTLTSRIIGGHNAKPGDFPHQISLQYASPEMKIPYTHFCSGSILNMQWILTAAHCLVSIETNPQLTFVIKAGKHDLSLNENSEQTSSIDQFFIHEEYNRNSEYQVGPYDIGLIKLTTSLQLNERVVSIGLPEANSEPQGTVILSGWGAVNDNPIDPEMPDILQTIELKIVDRSTCNNAVRTLLEHAGKPVPYDLVDETNICTENLTGGQSSCGADSGGPLICRDSDGITKVVGIVSWGMTPCGYPGGPSVYVKTSYFIEWINNVIAKN